VSSKSSLVLPRYAVAYYRVSTSEQGQRGLGLESQQASLRAFVSAHGWTLIGEYSDIASGKDDRREGFQAARARCRQLDVILVAARLDRITRRAHALSQLLEDGISIRAADMLGADDLMMRIYAAMAQKEDRTWPSRTFVTRTGVSDLPQEVCPPCLCLTRRGPLLAASLICRSPSGSARQLRQPA